MPGHAVYCVWDDVCVFFSPAGVNCWPGKSVQCHSSPAPWLDFQHPACLWAGNSDTTRIPFPRFSEKPLRVLDGFGRSCSSR